MATVSDLGVNIHADGADETIRALTRVGVAVDTSGNALRGFASTAVTSGPLIVGALLAVGAAAAKMAEHGVRSAADLQHAVAAIATIKPDLDTSALTKTLNDMSTRIPQSSKAIAESVYDIFSSIDNISAEAATGLAETFAKGATAAQTDAKTFGTAVSGVLNAYKLDVSDASKVSDVFFNTVNRGVVTGPELAASLGPAIAAAKNLGVSYEEAFAMIVGATKEGGPAAQNINNFTNLMAKLNTKEATADFALLGITIADSAGKLRSPIEVLRDLKGRLDGMTEAGKAAALLNIFPDIQARQGAQVIMSQLDAVDTALAENRTQTDSTAKAYKTMSETAVAQGELLKNTWTALSVDVADVALPAINTALGAVAGGVRQLRVDFETTKTGVQASATTMGEATEGVRQTVADLVELAKQPITFTWKIIREVGTPPAPETPEGEPPAVQPTGAMGDPFAGTGSLPPGTRGLGNEIEDFFGRAATQYAAGFDRLRGIIHDGAEESRGALIEAAVPVEAAAEELGEAVAEGIEQAAPAVINASQNIIETAGRLLAGAGGKVQDAIAAAANMFGDMPGKVAQLSNEIISQANASKALQESYSHLTGEQQAYIRVIEVQQGASAALKAELNAGYITQAQYTEALAKGTTGLKENALAARNRAEAEEAVKNAELGGLAAMQAHNDQRERERVAALGGQVAIRARTEALEDEKVAELGGHAAMQAHNDQRERTRIAALGGQVAIRARTEALEDERVAELGGYAAMQAHDDERERSRIAALGGQVGIRARTEALEAEKVAELGGYAAMQAHDDERERSRRAALGGEQGIRARTEALEDEKVAELGGHAAMRAHNEERERAKIAALGGHAAIRAHNEQLEREKEAALGGAAAVRAHAEALQFEKVAAEGASAQLDYFTNKALKAEQDRLAALVLNGQISRAEMQRQLDDFRRFRLDSQVVFDRPSGILGPGSLSSGGATSWAAGVQQQTQPIGAAMVEGVGEGVRARAGVVITAFTDVVDNAIAAAKRVAGIASPSRVATEQIGRPMVQGIVLGIESAQNELDDAMGRVVSRVTSAGRSWGHPWSELAMAMARGFADEFAPAMQQQAPRIGAALQQTLGDAIGPATQAGTDPWDQWWAAYYAGTTRRRAPPPAYRAQFGPDSDSGAVGRAVADWGQMSPAMQQAWMERSAALTAQQTADTAIASKGYGTATPRALERVADTIQATTQTLDRGQEAWVQFTAGTGLATRAVREFAGYGEAAQRAAAQFSQMATAGWEIAKAWAAALRAGEWLVAGIRVPAGLNTSQIYGSTATTTGQQQPTSRYGIPIFSPTTPGTLYGMAAGGWLTEPTLGVGLRSGRRTLMGEAGPEYVSPRGGGTTLVVNYHAPAVSMAPQAEMRQAVEQLGPTLVSYLREHLN